MWVSWKEWNIVQKRLDYLENEVRGTKYMCKIYVGKENEIGANEAIYKILEELGLEFSIEPERIVLRKHIK